MKADYKNWMPKGMVVGTFAGAFVSLVFFIVLGVAGILPHAASAMLHNGSTVALGVGSMTKLITAGNSV